MPSHPQSAAPFPELTAIVVVGQERQRAQVVLDAIGAQSAADRIELVIVDQDPTGSRVSPPQNVVSRTVVLPTSVSWGEVKAISVREARAPIVAFTEDHSAPSPSWAEAILRASGRWAAAGYTFKNANPGTYLSRAGFIADYAEWAYPMPEIETTHLPCNNIAYSREALLACGQNLGTLLHSDSLMHEHLLRQGRSVAMIRDAIVSHQNHESLGVLLEGNFAHCRLIGAGRVEAGKWNWFRRLAYGIAVPICVPLLKLYRIFRVQRKRSVLWADVIAGLPVSILVFTWSSIGEGIGYLFGYGNSIERFRIIETCVSRSAELQRETS